MSCFGNYQMRVRCGRLFLGIRDPVENRGVFVGINIADGLIGIVWSASKAKYSGLGRMEI